MLVNLEPLLQAAAERQGAVAAFNIFGYGWARTIVEAAESEQQGCILLVNPAMAAHLPPRLMAPMLLDLAAQAAVPICVQLDHGKDLTSITEALDAGFSSVMYDGSALPLADNLRLSQQVVELARRYQATVEGEVGQVRYTDVPGTVTSLSQAAELRCYSEESGVDAIAVSVGNVHRSQKRRTAIDYQLLAELDAASRQPLVVHGASGVPESDLIRMTKSGVRKYNFATLLRQAYGAALRQLLEGDQKIFDKLAIEQQVLPSLTPLVRQLLQLLAGKRQPQEEL